MEGNSSDLESGARDMNGLSLNSYSSGLQAQLQVSCVLSTLNIS